MKAQNSKSLFWWCHWFATLSCALFLLAAMAVSLAHSVGGGDLEFSPSWADAILMFSLAILLAAPPLIAEWAYLKQRRILLRSLWRSLFAVHGIAYISIFIPIVVLVIVGRFSLASSVLLVGAAILTYVTLVAMWRYAYIVPIWSVRKVRP